MSGKNKGKCKPCYGTGRIVLMAGWRETVTKTCSQCGGTGRKLTRRAK